MAEVTIQGVEIEYQSKQKDATRKVQRGGPSPVSLAGTSGVIPARAPRGTTLFSTATARRAGELEDAE
jgi:hypothetical protein